MAKKKEKKVKTTAVAKREKDKVKEEPIAVEARTASPSEEIVEFGVGEMGIKPFKSPENMTSMELIEFIRAKNTSRIQDEFELSYALWTAQDKKIHVNQGYEWADFCRDQCGISSAKANALLTMWGSLIEIGIANVKKLLGYSWYKIKLLAPAIKAGKISRRNAESWLEKCSIDGTKGMKADDLEAVIKGLVRTGKGDKDTLDTSLVPVKYMIPKYDIATIDQFESIAKAYLKSEVRGQYLINAAIEFSTNHANAQDAQAWRARGLSAVKELAERIAPVVALFMPTDPNQNTQEALGAFPFTTIYQGFPSESGERTLHYCIASSETEAKAFLKVKDVRAFKVEVAPSLRPKIAYQTPPTEAPAEETKTAKPTKGRKGKAKEEVKTTEEPKAEETPSSPKEEPKAKGKGKSKAKSAEPALTTNQKAVLGMTDEELKTTVVAMIKKLGIAQEAYKKKKVEFQSNLPTGLTSTQVMAAWLMDQDKK